MISNLKLLIATLSIALMAGFIIAGCKEDVVKTDAELSEALSNEAANTASDAGEPEREPGSPGDDLMGMGG